MEYTKEYWAKKERDRKYREEHKDRAKAYREAHKKELKEYNRAYYRTNKERLSAQRGRVERKKLPYSNRVEKRALVLKAYGGKCECCGEDNICFLSFHHGNGDGKKYREKGQGFLDWAVQNNFPKDKGIRLLCHNCHFAIHWYGGCPHKTELLAKP